MQSYQLYVIYLFVTVHLFIFSVIFLLTINRLLQVSPVDEGVDGVWLHSCSDGVVLDCVCYNHGRYVGVPVQNV